MRHAAIAALLMGATLSACGGGSNNGSANITPPVTTGSLNMSASVTLTAEESAQPEQIAVYAFSLPPGQYNLLGLQGTLSMTSSMAVFNQSLITVATLAGSCPASGAVYPSYDAIDAAIPNIIPIQGFILKSPDPDTSEINVNLNLPVGLPISNCMILFLDWEGQSPVTMASSLSMTYVATSTPSNASLLATGQEFVFGVDYGAQSTTNDSLSFVQEAIIPQDGTILALLGDISDSAFPPVPAPAGAWQTSNDFYLVPGGCPAQIMVNSSGLTPQAGSYYADIPANAQHILSVPLSGMQSAVATQTVYQPMDLQVHSGDCLLNLFGLDAPQGGGIDSETQVQALFQPAT